MAKYSAGLTMVMSFQPTGSTVVTVISGSARNLSITESIDSADSTGYGNANREYVKTIKDLAADFEYMLDDTTYATEDLLAIGAAGTFIAAPNGTTTGKKKITISAFVSERSREYPYDDVAMASISLLPNGAVTEGVYP